MIARSPTGNIVGALIGEYAVVPIGGTFLQMCELSDFATLSTHQGRGIMSALQIVAINLIEAKHGSGNVLMFAEDRAALPSVVASSRRAGMVTVLGGDGRIGHYPSDVEIAAREHKDLHEGVVSPVTGNSLGSLVPVVWTGRQD